MKKNFFVSYIVPCYKIQEYLPRCLDSLTKQSINADADVEFVLVNDGSPDDCLELIKTFSAKDARAVVVDQKNQGVSAARNAGLNVARGEYVFFLDGDDYLTDDASQILYDICMDHNSDIIITNAYKVKDGHWNNKTNWNVCSKMHDGIYYVEDFVKTIDVLPVSFKAYRRELLVNNNILYDVDLKVGEVFTFFLHALQFSTTVAVSNRRMMNYVVRDSGVMRKIDLERDMTILKTMNRMDKYASTPNYNLKKYLSYNASFYRIVRIFSLNKYVRQSQYTPEIGYLLDTIRQSEEFGRVLKFIAFQKKVNRRTCYAIGQIFLPSKIFFFILKQFTKMKDGID